MSLHSSEKVTFQVTVTQLTLSSQLPKQDLRITVCVDGWSKITCSGKISEDGLTVTWNHPFLFSAPPSARVEVSLYALPKKLSPEWDKQQLGDQMVTEVASMLQSGNGWQCHVPGLFDGLGILSMTCSTCDVLSVPAGHNCRPALMTYHRRVFAFGLQFKSLPCVSMQIELGLARLDLCPFGHVEHRGILRDLALSFDQCYEQEDKISNLERAIEIKQTRLDVSPQGHPEHPEALQSLVTSLKQYCSIQCDGAELGKLIEMHQRWLDLCPLGHPDHLEALMGLASSLQKHYKTKGNMADLNRAIKIHQKWLDLCPLGYPYHTRALSGLASSLFSFYKIQENTADLDRVVKMQQECLDLCPLGHPDHTRALSGLASSLFSFYKIQENTADLDRVVEMQQECLDLCPLGHPDHTTALSELASSWHAHFQKQGDMKRLDMAIEAEEARLDLCPPGHPEHIDALGNLAVSLRAHYHELGNLNDLNRAIDLEEQKLELCPLGHPSHGFALQNLASSLKDHFTALKSHPDLIRAIELLKEALNTYPVQHSHFALVAGKLAETILLSVNSSSSNQAPYVLDDAFETYRLLKQCGPAVSLDFWKAAQNWIKDAEKYGHSSVLEAYQTSLSTLDHFISFNPSLDSRHETMQARVVDLANNAFSCAMRHGDFKMAVEFLEQGQGVLWNQLVHLDISLAVLEDLGNQGHELAEKFTQLSTDLRKHAVGSGGEDPYWQVQEEWQSVVNEIRHLEGFSRFLLPPCFDDLQQAAEHGPIVIVNASIYGCDALIVLHTRPPVHVPLPCSLADVLELCSNHSQLTRNPTAYGDNRESWVKEMLRELWSCVVEPIADALQNDIRLLTGSRIWWCPTSKFMILPFHAAGPYRKAAKGFLDLYVSSYAPSLSALIRTRDRACSQRMARDESGTPNVVSFAAVGQRYPCKDMKLPELPEVEHEIQRIRYETNMPPDVHFETITGSAATIEGTIQAFRDHRWVHISCHGAQHAKRPFESWFALGDGKLTLMRIIQERYTNSELAFLFACHTALGDESTPDEVLHLAAGMQFAGFNGVVGTLWKVDDSVAHQVVTRFYREMFNRPTIDFEYAAMALNKAVVESAEVSLEKRIVFVHIGI